MILWVSVIWRYLIPLTASFFGEKSRLGAVLEHFAIIDDPREPWKVAHPLAEVLLLVVCGTIADCDDYDHIAGWGEARQDRSGSPVPDAYELGTK